MKFSAVLTVSAFVFAARAFAVLSPVPENVFAPDDRKPTHGTQAPSRWIGQLILPSGGMCTATLVYSDLILTAAHCVINKKATALRGGIFRFRLGVTRGRAVDESDVSDVWTGTLNTSAQRASDWAILRLKKPLGEVYGWMGVHASDLEALLGQDVIGITGYSTAYRAGQTASAEFGCRFTVARQNGTFLHDCDTLPGISGAPMYRVLRDEGGIEHSFIVAINVASPKDSHGNPYVGISYSDKYANIAVPTAGVMSKLRELVAVQK